MSGWTLQRPGHRLGARPAECEPSRGPVDEDVPPGHLPPPGWLDTFLSGGPSNLSVADFGGVKSAPQMDLTRDLSFPLVVCLLLAQLRRRPLSGGSCSVPAIFTAPCRPPPPTAHATDEGPRCRQTDLTWTETHSQLSSCADVHPSWTRARGPAVGARAGVALRGADSGSRGLSLEMSSFLYASRRWPEQDSESEGTDSTSV